MQASKKNLVYVDDEGPKALIAAEITFYFNTTENREGLIAAYDVAMKRIGDHVRWYRTEAMSQSRKMSGEVREFLSVWFKAGTKLRKEYELTLTSDADPDLCQPWGLRFGLEPALLPEGDSGFLQVNLPMEVVAEDPGAFLALALDMGGLIGFRSGHAGYGVQYDEGDLDDERDERIGAWCRRYLCVDYRDFAASCEFMGSNIKGVGWLTFLDKDFAKQVGGIAGIKKKLPAGALVRELANGLAIQAGAEPILGDKNCRENIDNYKAIFRLVEPVVVQEDLALPGFEDDGSIEWVNRFA